MVPWHPPCALISLIFSSLDPETNCCYIEICKSSDSPLLRFATGLHIESLFVQLSRCRQFLPFFQQLLRFSVRFANPESDTDLKRKSSTASDATLCVFVNPRRARLTRSATLLPCFIHPVGGSYGRSLRLFSFQLSLTQLVDYSVSTIG